MKFDIFVGIDQTGAVKANGQPRQLDICIAEITKTKTKYYTKLKIEKLCYNQIHAEIKKCIPEFDRQKVLICVDSVFGLPQELSVQFSKIIATAKNFNSENKEFGSATAHAFFNDFLKSKKIIPKRIVENIVKANSVFNLKPFQKNIGCGTYRIIKDLSVGQKWFSIWPFEKPIYQFVVAEGYPSFFWKHLLNLRTRNVIELKLKLKTEIKKLDVDTIDEADSFVLAYGAMKSVDFMNNFKIDPKYKNEGWILGVPNE